MSTVGLLLTIFAAAFVGVGSYMYNDGHDHRQAGLISGVIGWGATIVNGAAAQQEVAQENSRCTLEEIETGVSCVDQAGGFYPYIFRGIFGFVGNMLLEIAIILTCGLVGYLIAVSTRKQPGDGRKASVMPPQT